MFQLRRRVGGRRLRGLLLFPILGILLAVSVVCTIRVGSTDIPAGEVFGILWDRDLSRGKGACGGSLEHVPFSDRVEHPAPQGAVRSDLRGRGFPVCGAAMQALVLNPIADPYILGISSGASAGAAWALLMPLPFFAGQYQTTAAAFLGAMVSALAVYTMARAAGGGKLSPVPLLLAGTAVNAVMSAVTQLSHFSR